MNKIAGSFDDAYEFGNSTFSIRKMILPRKNKDGLTKVMIEVRQHKYTGTTFLMYIQLKKMANYMQLSYWMFITKTKE